MNDGKPHIIKPWPESFGQAPASPPPPGVVLGDDWNDGYERKKDTTVPSLRKMFSGMQTPPTYLHLRAHTAGDIKRCGVEKFLDERWVEKDEILARAPPPRGGC